MSGDNIGMMEGAFFVSKGVLLDWMNELLDVSFQLSIYKLEISEVNKIQLKIEDYKLEIDDLNKKIPDNWNKKNKEFNIIYKAKNIIIN